MKKTAILKLCSLATFAAASLLSIAHFSSHKKVQTVNADSTVDYGDSGLVYLELDTNEWKYSGSKIALYMFNNSVSKNAWGGFVTPDGTSRYVEYTYSLDFTPTGCIAFRFDPGVQVCGQWCFDNDRSNSAIWSTTNDITFKKVIALGTYYDSSKWTRSSSHDLLTEVKGGASDSWSVATVDVQLTHVKINGNDKLEVYGDVSLPAGTYFKVVKGGSVWCDNFDAHSSVRSNFTGGSGSNIHNINAGTYEFYFVYEDGSLWITDPVYAAADEWAQYFLNHSGCDSTGTNLPSGWSACASEYAKLSGGSKDVIYGATAKSDGTYIEQAVARYDHAVSAHPSLTRFIVDSSSHVREVNITSVYGYTPNTDSNNLIVIVSIVSLISASTLVGLIVIKRRKGIAK